MVDPLVNPITPAKYEAMRNRLWKLLEKEKQRNQQLRAEVERLRERATALEMLVKGKDGLLAAYRLGRPASEKTWRLLEKAQKRLAALYPEESDE